MNLRLNELAEMVEPGSRVADIGTDHAYLPIALVQTGKVDFAIASDIAAGPLANAEEDIATAGLEDKISTRLGAGLATITTQDRIDTVVIAGMGGKLMTTILDDAWNKDFIFATLVLEPNVGECGVRKWLVAHSYQITAEKIVAEAGHVYELIKAQKSPAGKELSPAELYFGPFLLRAKGPIFEEKWRGQLAYHRQLLTSLKKAKQPDRAHIKQVEEEITMIEGVLHD